METIKCLALNANAQLPRKGSALAAGYDLTSIDYAVLKPGQREMISTGLAIQVPPGWYGRIAPRSGLAARYGLDVLAGVVDADFTGEVKVVLINLGDEEYVVQPGERIAQLVVERCANMPVALAYELEESLRGMDGFGSTGV